MENIPHEHDEDAPESRWIPSGIILGPGAAEITFVGDDGITYYDC